MYSHVWLSLMRVDGREEKGERGRGGKIGKSKVLFFSSPKTRGGAGPQCGRKPLLC